jgi:5-methylthioribose kinase
MTIQLSTSTTSTEVADYLLEHELMTAQPIETTLSKPGEGNMNVVLRFEYDGQSIILKQSKPYVNKYPSIPAPQERIHTEAMFYQYAQRIEKQAANMPKLLHYDAANFLMVLEDLGKGSDLLAVYQQTKRISKADFTLLLHYLNDLHSIDWSATERKEYPNNLNLRQLNHQHIFVLPFQTDNGFDLNGVQIGLADLALPYVGDEGLKQRIDTLGKRYLSEGLHLLHGDYYPGSWVRTASGIKIIDPEFSFMGEVEFDLGVLMGHSILAGHKLEEVEVLVRKHYQVPFELTLARAYAGVEMMRRLIGIAQLPLPYALSEKKQLLETAKTYLLQ